MKKTSGKGQGRPAKENTRKRKTEESKFSPERLEDGATVTTDVLNAILSQPERSYYSRHWGINE
jgi:hypothetical protein